MATDTNIELRNQVIYSVFVRNHTEEGTFAALVEDLPRIRSLGTDIVWLMPIHPVGEVNRKGSLGSPYANKDYRAVNPEFGTMEDFRALVDAIHAQGMKCMIDVVYHHTSPDAVLVQEHPEFFWRRADGSFGNHIGDWSDIIDLDFDVPELWDYLIETLVGWAKIVDGFRCDVASLVPVEFWERARAEVERVRPGCIWLAETIHRSFGMECRRRGLVGVKDVDEYRAFDIEYDYDVREAFERLLRGELPLSAYLDLLDFQESAYPDNYVKMRCLENHDTARIAELADGFDLRSLTAFAYLLKGTTLIYAGQEVGATHAPSLFDKDVVDWSGLDGDEDLSELMAALARIKHEALPGCDYFGARADDEFDVAAVIREGAGKRVVGVFSLRGATCHVDVDMPDGTYLNLIDGLPVEVSGGTLACDGTPVIISREVGHAGDVINL